VNAHQPSSVRPAHPVLHKLAPVMPVRDADDAQFRIRNFQSSMKSCPTCWRQYFQALASVVAREVN
jgi:hypothetical protein